MLGLRKHGHHFRAQGTDDGSLEQVNDGGLAELGTATEEVDPG